MVCSMLDQYQYITLEIYICSKFHTLTQCNHLSNTICQKLVQKKKENTHTNGAKTTQMIDVNISDMQCTIFDMQCTKRNTVESSFVRGVWMFMDFANCISPKTAGTWHFACECWTCTDWWYSRVFRRTLTVNYLISYKLINKLVLFYTQLFSMQQICMHSEVDISRMRK